MPCDYLGAVVGGSFKREGIHVYLWLIQKHLYLQYFSPWIGKVQVKKTITLKNEGAVGEIV